MTPSNPESGHAIGSYLTRGAHLPKYVLDMIEPYIPHRIHLPKDEISLRVAERVERHQRRHETTLNGGLVEYRSTQRPFTAALTDFRRDYRLYHFPSELAEKYPDGRAPIELGEGVTIIDGVLRIITVPAKGGLPTAQILSDEILHSRETTHTRVIGLGTLHDLGIR